MVFPDETKIRWPIFLPQNVPICQMIGKSRWEPGLVHRLDRETSGLVLVAKTQAAFDDLRLQFRRRQIKKNIGRWCGVSPTLRDPWSTPLPMILATRGGCER